MSFYVRRTLSEYSQWLFERLVMIDIAMVVMQEDFWTENLSHEVRKHLNILNVCFIITVADFAFIIPFVDIYLSTCTNTIIKLSTSSSLVDRQGNQSLQPSKELQTIAL